MKILISVVSPEEAKIALKGNPDILDIKNPVEGSLGAQFPWVLKDIVAEVKNSNTLCSATLGDLPYKPGTASLAAYGAVSCGVEYIKAGLYGARNYKEACDMMKNIVRSVRMVNKDTTIVASGYADFKRFRGLPYMELVRAANCARANVVMLDTAIKDGKDLFDAMDSRELTDFIEFSHELGLIVALAGSIKEEHLEYLSELNPDIIGIRGAVCKQGERMKGIDPLKIKEFMNYAKSIEQKIPVEALWG